MLSTQDVCIRLFIAWRKTKFAKRVVAALLAGLLQIFMAFYEDLSVIGPLFTDGGNHLQLKLSKGPSGKRTKRIPIAYKSQVCADVASTPGIQRVTNFAQACSLLKKRTVGDVEMASAAASKWFAQDTMIQY